MWKYRARDEAKAVEHLPSKCKDLSSNRSTTTKKKVEVQNFTAERSCNNLLVQPQLTLEAILAKWTLVYAELYL
jgi:hypothetical protein